MCDPYAQLLLDEVHAYAYGHVFNYTHIFMHVGVNAMRLGGWRQLDSKRSEGFADSARASECLLRTFALSCALVTALALASHEDVL